MTEAGRTAEAARARPPQVPASARAVLSVDLNALRANWARLNAASGTAECAGVIKASAYGLGLAQIAGALTQEGCRTFFVASIDEGRAARLVQPGATIYILDGLLPGAEEHYAGFDLRPVLSSLAEARDWAAFCKARGARLAAGIHVDTGMNRLGMPEDDVAKLAKDRDLLAAFDMTLVMSHLACADQPANPMNEIQRARFETLRAMLPPAPASLANSGGIYLGPKFHFDVVRPGIALYGGRAHASGPNPMRTVVRLTARILQVRDVPAGATVGYGATYRVARPTRVATIACGYADGFFRALSVATGEAGSVGYIGDHPVPIVGRVSMDLITADVTNVPPKLARRGGWVEVMGDRVTLDDLTDRAGTIGYELLSRLSPRVHRVYEEG
ncbi:MAG TPA: alanine racemase [Hyphomicrobiaceae bacterium]|nr:alanine racemase [Hyphomicrobiaceae bacterium]